MNIFIYLKSSFLVVLIALFFTGCVESKNPEPPKKVSGNFDINKFSGSWFELATMKNDENLTNTTVNFSIDKENIKIVRSSVNKDKKPKKEEFMAKFGLDRNVSVLSVSKFGLMYDYAYIVRNDNYKYVMIYGDKKDQFSILSRSNTIPEALKVIYLSYAKKDGYDVDKIIWIKQD